MNGHSGLELIQFGSFDIGVRCYRVHEECICILEVEKRREKSVGS